MPSGLLRIPYGVYPVIAVTGAAVIFAGSYVARLATRPDVVWNRKKNPHPYLSVRQDETIKMFDPSGHFKSSWKRNDI